MTSKQIAAAAAGLCLMWGTAQAGNDGNAGSAVEVPEAVVAPNNGMILELGPRHGGGNADDAAAMQMLILQLLMMQSEGAANAEMPEAPRAPAGVGI